MKSIDQNNSVVKDTPYVRPPRVRQPDAVNDIPATTAKTTKPNKVERKSSEDVTNG